MIGSPRSFQDIIAHYQGLTTEGDTLTAARVAQYLPAADAQELGVKVPAGFMRLSARHEDIVAALATDAAKIRTDLVSANAQVWAANLARLKADLWLLRDTELLNEVAKVDGKTPGPVLAVFVRAFAKYRIRPATV